MAILWRGNLHHRFTDVSRNQLPLLPCLTNSRYARIHRMGIRNLAPDDYLMLLAAVSFYNTTLLPIRFLLDNRHGIRFSLSVLMLSQPAAAATYFSPKNFQPSLRKTFENVSKVLRS